MEGDSLVRHVTTRWMSLLQAIEKILNCLPAIKSYFQNVGQEECPSLIWKYIEDENGETGNRHLYAVSPKLFDDLRSLEKDELTASERFDVMCRLRQKLVWWKNDSFFRNKTASELKLKNKKVTRKGQSS